MSTNPPKAPYGHYPASLGGKGMGERRETDLIYSTAGQWICIEAHCLTGFVHHLYYTRRIDPGPEHELVGEDVVPRCSINNPEAQFTLDGTTWMNFLNGEKLTVKQIIERNERDQEVKGTILAIRRKVVKEQTASLCKCGHEVGLHFYHSHGGGKTACCDPDCKCDKYESPEQPSSPAWIPLLERIAVALESQVISAHKIQEYIGSKLTQPPQPKTQKALDEEACNNAAAEFGYIGDKGFDSGFHAACEYVRSLPK